MKKDQLNAVKAMAIPLALIFTIMPVYTVGLILLGRAFGPFSILVFIFSLGLIALFVWIGIERHQKRMKDREAAASKTCTCGAVRVENSHALRDR